jgi:hypothetical protein
MALIPGTDIDERDGRYYQQHRDETFFGDGSSRIDREYETDVTAEMKRLERHERMRAIAAKARRVKKGEAAFTAAERDRLLAAIILEVLSDDL